MTVTALCIEMGALSETFAYELAAALGVQVIDLRPLELGMAEWHLFCNGASGYRDADESPRLHSTASEIEERSVRVAEKIVEAAKGNALIIGWSAAAVFASSFRVTRVCIRAPQPQAVNNIMRGLGDTASTAPYPAGPEFWKADPKWLDLNNFDLILDSGCMSAADCQREIVALVNRREHMTDVKFAEPVSRSAPSREQETRSPAWPNLTGCAVAVGIDDVLLGGTVSQEAAIARIEQHLHGPKEMSVPANPLCRGTPY
jgi:hypothetical protein